MQDNSVVVVVVVVVLVVVVVEVITRLSGIRLVLSRCQLSSSPFKYAFGMLVLHSVFSTTILRQSNPR